MSSTIEEIAEVDKFISLSKFQTVKHILQQHKEVLLKKQNSEEVNKLKATTATTDVESINESTSSINNVPSKSSTSTPTTTTTTTNSKPASIPTLTNAYIPIETYSWDQGEYNTPYITLYVDIEQVGSITKDKIKCNFTKDSFDLCIVELNNKNYR